MRPDLIMRSILPVIMAGILGIYGLIISIVISSVSKLVPSFWLLHAVVPTLASLPLFRQR